MTYSETPVGKLASAVVSDCMGRFAAMDSAIRRLSGGDLIGPAFCVQTVAGDNATVHEALDWAPDGCVLVIEAGGATGRAVWGNVLTEAAVQRGVRGLVVNGVVRDLADILQREWPVYALGSAPAGPHKAGHGRIGFPVAVGGVTVTPGDLVVADADGIAVVPADSISTIIEVAAERERLEASWIDQIRNGASSRTVLGIPCTAALSPQLMRGKKEEKGA